MVTYPKDWDNCTLGNLGEVKMCKRIFAHQTSKSGQIPFYKIGTFGGKADAFISRELYDRYRNAYSFPKMGDILLSAAGTIGRTVIYDGKDAYFQDSNIVWLEVDENQVDKGFLKYFYDSYPWKNLEGTTIKRLYNGLIRNTAISLPSLPEQKAIASALSTFDTYIDSLTELIEKKRNIRDGALEDLASGKLNLSGYRNEWIRTTLKRVASYRKDRGTSPKRHYISTENMNQNFCGIQPYSDSSVVCGCEFSSDNVLIANIRPYLKKIWYAEFDGCCSADVLVLAANEGVNPKLLYYILANDRYVNYVMAVGTKGIKMPRGDKKIIMEYELLIPTDYKEQEAIAAALTSMDKEITNLEAERDKMMQIREGAMYDLLTGRVRLKV